MRTVGRTRRGAVSPAGTLRLRAGGAPPRRLALRHRCSAGDERPTTSSEASGVEEEAPSTRTDQSKFRSSWKAKSKKKEGGDYLWELGQSDMNMNIDTAQTSKFIPSYFAQDVVADIADGSLRKFEFRKLDNIKGEYYVPERFKEKLSIHIAKNYLKDDNSDWPEMPLILGIWGGKGEGKSFLTELTLKKLKVEPIILSSGELEDEWAGKPAKLIRERYRRAAELSKVRGVLSALVINDIDAGVGKMSNTQNTVNSQMVIGTLMNICDNPNQVSIGQSWIANERQRRIPIIVTGNDFSTLYAPLLRDGRMEKFYWKPDSFDKLMMIYTMFKDDGVTEQECAQLVQAFENQSLDFFGALRSRLVDNLVMERVAGTEGGVKEYLRGLLKTRGKGNKVEIDMSMERMMEEGRSLVKEQEHVKRVQLADAYLEGAELAGNSGTSLPEQVSE